MELSKIVAVIRKHHLMTLATMTNERPWVAHVFYAWMPADGQKGESARASKVPGAGSEEGRGNGQGGGYFVFTTDPATRHGSEMTAHPHVAGGIALETRIVGRVQGLQIEGEVRRPQKTEHEAARRAYLKRFPYAAAAGGLSMWLFEPTLMKLTDNTLGFGTKLVWTKFPF